MSNNQEGLEKKIKSTITMWIFPILLTLIGGYVANKLNELDQKADLILILQTSQESMKEQQQNMQLMIEKNQHDIQKLKDQQLQREKDIGKFYEKYGPVLNKLGD